MNIEHLKLFVRIANTNNISSAGEALGLSAAVASNHINKLEDNLKVRLIHRTTRKVSLTEEGKAFLPYAEDVIASVLSAKASLSNEANILQGRLRISAPASFGKIHLIPALTEFLKNNPALTIDLKLSDSIVDLVEGGFDIAIRNSKLKDSSLIARKLTSDQRIICAAPSYIKENGEPQHPNDLKQHQCLTLTGLDHWVFDDHGSELNIKAKGNLSADNGEAIRDACINGLGVTICSKWIAHQQIADGSLIQVLKDYPLLSDTSIWAIYPSSRQVAPKVRAFIDYCKQHFENNNAWEL
ncbi:LysR family transcriptional regulator [Psychromonas sp. B3M02]|uniref:LysR family transcriptional regulator n=1 Tax=Psychromonas sp. B3M02 TaxID=2267226 RepID=UPI000DE9D6FB|nr:LysR family transcriptional regulator [Psychromonas sp. B3M02]RBW45707.1 LysR family transcriptional regulator [Psychromonas sp. B3M02]